MNIYLQNGFRLLKKSVVETNHTLDDEKSTCTKTWTDITILRRLERCESYNLSDDDCVRYISEELTYECGDSFNCILTNYGDAAAHSSFSGMNEK